VRAKNASVTFLAVLLFLLGSYSVRANTVPTRGQSSYGEAASFLQSAPGTSVVSSGVTIDEQSLCSASDSTVSGTTSGCALSYAYKIASSIPAGTTQLTITIPIPAGAVISIDSLSSTGMGILTDDDGFSGSNVFSTSGLSQADLAALPNTAISFGTNSSGPYITFNDPLTLPDFPSGLNGLAFFLDVATDSSGDPFTCGTDSHGNPSCSGTQIPPIPFPALQIVPSASNMPEPSVLLNLASGLGLLGLYRRRVKI